jgi:protein-S-isoprenylcysteine O-methyltransferase Ste14
MTEIILGVAILFVVGGLVLLVWAIRQVRDWNPKPRYRRNGGKF